MNRYYIYKWKLTTFLLLNPMYISQINKIYAYRANETNLIL